MAASVLSLGLTSCEDFLDRPTEDSYVASGYYKTDAECIAAVDYLYNSPWYDFQRGFFKVGEVLSGNYYWDGSPYQNFSLNSNDVDLRNMSYSLWAVNGHANIVRHYIEDGSASEAVKNQTMGECLLWKAMAYFYLVRTFGDVPIVHDNVAMIEDNTYNEQPKVYKADVYEYIVMTLEKAIELLPEKCAEGRLDKYCAKGLLAKVYLTKAGVTGTLNNADLQKAADYAKDVIENSGRELEKNYADIFKLEGNKSPENMIAWRWVVSSQWTSQNTFQSDLGMTGIDEYGDVWGEWNGPSVDLQDAFGYNILDDPSTRPDVDTRRKATMMTVGDVVPYLWRDKGGFDYMRFEYDSDYNPAAWGEHRSPTGCNVVKHLYGNTKDHQDALNIAPARMSYALPTHILRLADVYLIYAEAKLGASRTTSTAADVIAAFDAVHQRAVPSANASTSVSWEDIWKERRLEFAMEGDRWYDYVRVSYYDPDFCVKELTAQKRNAFWGLNDLYKAYATSNSWKIDTSKQGYDYSTAAPNVNVMLRQDSEVSNKGYFALPMSAEDVLFNKNLGSNVEGEHVDVRSTYTY